MTAIPHINGDLNNTSVLRKPVQEFRPDLAYAYRSLEVPEQEDDGAIRAKYRPFLLRQDVASRDWVSKLELSTVTKLAEDDLKATGGERLKVLVLYGSLRSR